MPRHLNNDQDQGNTSTEHIVNQSGNDIEGPICSTDNIRNIAEYSLTHS